MQKCLFVHVICGTSTNMCVLNQYIYHISSPYSLNFDTGQRPCMADTYGGGVKSGNFAISMAKIRKFCRLLAQPAPLPASTGCAHDHHVSILLDRFQMTSCIHLLVSGPYKCNGCWKNKITCTRPTYVMFPCHTSDYDL